LLHEGAEVGEDKVEACAAEEDVTLIDTLTGRSTYAIITTEATEHVGAIGSLAEETVVTRGTAVEGVVEGVVAGARRPNRQLRALSIGTIGYWPGLGDPREAIAAASIDANATDNRMRFIGATPSLKRRRIVHVAYFCCCLRVAKFLERRAREVRMTPLLRG
jgi:hypothetical protein